MVYVASDDTEEVMMSVLTEHQERDVDYDECPTVAASSCVAHVACAVEAREGERERECVVCLFGGVLFCIAVDDRER